MALGKRRQRQTSFWVETSQLQARGRHPFYSRLNEILDRAKFDTYAERICRKYYAAAMGRPSIAPGVYFRCFLMGYFEGIDSERGIAYRVSDSLSLREFLGLSLEEQTPDHSTLSKTRRRMSLGTHKAVFRWVLKRLAAEGLLSGKNLGVDATTLEANAALRSIVRRDNGASYDEHVTKLMHSEGVEELTPAERQRFDRKRKKSLSNRDWVNPHVIVSHERRLHNAEVTVHYHNHPLVGLGSNADLFTAIHAAVEKLEKQAIKVRAKWRDNRRGARDRGLLAPEAVPPAAEGEAPKRVFRVNSHPDRKPMTLDEALLEMESGRHYLVFQDEYI
ncbi:MAG: hypothetical protein FJW38_29325 [Acidobacteria bacterium]|nr:hypothetical protein [Acidobacteriota bacterium]